VTWLDRIKDRLSTVISEITDRVFKTTERRELDRYERSTEDDVEIRRQELTVWQRTGERLEPFSTEVRYSQATRTHRDTATGRLISKSDYGIRLKNWRLDMAASYIERAHPDWTEEEIVDALLRVDELRASSEPDEWIDVEIGEIFS